MDLDAFRTGADQWLATNRHHAPPDYGAIVAPGLVDRARAWQVRLADAGYAGIHRPADHGGRGLTVDHTAAWLATAARHGVPPVLNMVGLVLAAEALLAWGTEAQQTAHLGPTARGERVWCQLFSEPGAGSDLASLTTRAEPSGDGFVVTGQKTWASNASVADWGILLARTGPDGSRHRGLSFFCIDLAAAGVEIRPIRQMTGEAEFDEVFLEGVALPADALIGPRHEGWRVAMSTLTHERGHIGAAAVGLRTRLDAALALGGGPTEPRDAGLVTRSRTLELLARRQGPVATVAASLLKLGLTELAFDQAVAATDRRGSESMLTGDDSAGLLAAPGGRIAGGTSQVQRDLIGERLLGLPRDRAGT